MYLCTSKAPPAFYTWRSVCGICDAVHDGCRCYSYKDKGVVRRWGKYEWSAQLGLDLMEPERYLGDFYRTRADAGHAIEEASDD